MKDKSITSGHKLIKNTILFMLGTVGTKILTYLLVPFYTSILSTDEFGVCDTIFTTVSLLYPLFTLVIGEAVFRFTMDKEYDKKKVFSIGLSITFRGFIIACLCSPLLFLFSSFRPYFSLILLYYFSTTLQVLFSQFAKSINKIFSFSLSSIVGTFIILTSTILFLKYIPFGVMGYLLAYTIGNFCMCIYLFISCQLYKYITWNNHEIKSVRNSMIKYSIPIIPNAASWWISTSSDKYVLNFFSGLCVTGIYSVAYKMPSLMTLISSVFLSAWQISAVEEYSNSEKEKYYSLVYKKFSVVLFIFVSFLLLFNKFLSSFLFSKEFYAAWKYVPILLMAYLFHDLANYLGSIYNASKETKQLFVSTMLGAIVNIILNFALIPTFSAYGAAFATMCSFFVVWIYRVITVNRIVKIQINMLSYIVNLLLLSVQTVIELTELEFGIFISLCVFFILLILNFGEIKMLFKDLMTIINRKFRIRGCK